MIGQAKGREPNVIFVDFRLRGSFPDDPKAEEKRRALERLVESSMVMVVLDARTGGVDVPSKFAGDPALRLNVSRKFGYPFRFDRLAIWATLTFDGVPHDCVIPWGAVHSMISHVTQETVMF